MRRVALELGYRGASARPEPEIEGSDRRVLFDSNRHWLDQLEMFKAWRDSNDSQAA